MVRPSRLVRWSKPTCGLWVPNPSALDGRPIPKGTPHRARWLGPTNVQDWSFQCPSNTIWAFKIYLSQNKPSNHNPKLKRKTSLDVLNIPCPPEEPTSVGHCHYQKYSQLVDCWFFTLYWKDAPHDSCTYLIKVWYFISTFLDRRLGFELALQLIGCNLRALQNETNHSCEGFNLWNIDPKLGPMVWPPYETKWCRVHFNMSFSYITWLNYSGDKMVLGIWLNIGSPLRTVQGSHLLVNVQLDLPQSAPTHRPNFKWVPKPF